MLFKVVVNIFLVLDLKEPARKEILIPMILIEIDEVVAAKRFLKTH